MPMYHMFSAELRESLFSQIDAAVAKADGPTYAAFDADGTLWEFDLGEEFFQFQIDNCQLGLPEKPFDHYHQLKAKNPTEAYLWLAQINEGKSIDQVRSWANQCFASLDVPFFPAQKDLIQYLLDRSVEVFIVTASVKWAVEPGGRALGLSNENVIGISTAIKDGIVSSQQEGPITYREGKALALLQKTAGKKPLLCSGNTMGDKHLLESSEIALAVRSASTEHENFSTEQELYNLAKYNSWFTHSFK